MLKLTRKVAVFAMVVLAASIGSSMTTATSDIAQADSRAQTVHQSFLRVSYKDGTPAKKHVKIGLNKSMVVELPREVRDVLVSNPKLLDAVVHTANRVYLIAMLPGEANAFFFDKNGEQILTLEVTISRDLTALKKMMNRLIPGAKINLENVNDNIVLTGNVRTPADASRASDLAARFVKKKEYVMNMLSVESREQVMLKVQVIEMNRNILKQFGVNLGADILSGNFQISPLTANGFPLTSSLLTIPNGQALGFTAAVPPANGVLQQIFQGNSYKNSGVNTGWASGGNTIKQFGLNKSMVVELPREVRDVLVSNPKLLDAVVHTANRVYLIAMLPGEANAFFFDKNGEQILTLEVTISRDLTALKKMMNRLIPGAKINLENVNDNIVLTGNVRTPADASRASDLAARFVKKKEYVMNMLSVESREQVMLKVQVIEMNRNILKQFGVNLGADILSGNFQISPLTANGFPLTSSLLTIPNGQALGFTAAVPPANGVLQQIFQGNSYQNSGVNTGWASGGNTIKKSLQALERNGLLRTLAEPNLTAISGETANFLAGGQFPIPIVGRNGEISVEWKEFGVKLAFSPMVVTEGRISMKINTEVSELTSDGAVTTGSISINALKVRKAESTIELPSGGSMVMAGLLSDDIRQNIDGVPGLKNLPILGTLFRSRDFIKKETELVIIITPYIVKPVAKSKLGRPDDGFMPASDGQANFLGRLNRVHGETKRMPVARNVRGDYGFIVD